MDKRFLYPNFPGQDEWTRERGLRLIVIGSINVLISGSG